ncbi:hypothetical protein K474DRAFT_819186 [Panus rudis PR-1116 ss-1]|nr:hypothetical protein K474DRAFT_819186 [Panus rudis PR-1116 ss-1]
MSLNKDLVYYTSYKQSAWVAIVAPRGGGGSCQRSRSRPACEPESAFHKGRRSIREKWKSRGAYPAISILSASSLHTVFILGAS